LQLAHLSLVQTQAKLWDIGHAQGAKASLPSSVGGVEAAAASL
jgi:hypothetical protein